MRTSSIQPARGGSIRRGWGSVRDRHRPGSGAARTPLVDTGIDPPRTDSHHGVLVVSKQRHHSRPIRVRDPSAPQTWRSSRGCWRLAVPTGIRGFTPASSIRTGARAWTAGKRYPALEKNDRSASMSVTTADGQIRCGSSRTSPRSRPGYEQLRVRTQPTLHGRLGGGGPG